MNCRTKSHLEKNNMKTFKTLSILITAFTLLIYTVNAQDIPEPTSPPRLVNDFTGTLTESQINDLERKLVAFNDSTSTQIAIVMVNSLHGYAPSQFAYEIGEKWNVGQKKFNNGIVVLVKPKTTREKGRAFIATGYGLEGAIPDAIAKRIVENEMIPYFKNNDYYTGLDKATSILISLASGEYTAGDYKKQTRGSPLATFVPFLVIIIIYFLIQGNRRRYYSTGKRHRSSLPFWTALWLGGSLAGRSHGGGWNNFSSGSGSFGGGFGGFGGGSFGGGGAGGSW